MQIGERLAGAEAEVMDVEASVPDGPVSRGVLRLRGLGGSGEGESKEEKAGTLQHEVLLSTRTTYGQGECRYPLITGGLSRLSIRGICPG